MHFSKVLRLMDCTVYFRFYRSEIDWWLQRLNAVQVRNKERVGITYFLEIKLDWWGDQADGQKKSALIKSLIDDNGMQDAKSIRSVMNLDITENDLQTFDNLSPKGARNLQERGEELNLLGGSVKSGTLVGCESTRVTSRQTQTGLYIIGEKSSTVPTNSKPENIDIEA